MAKTVASAPLPHCPMMAYSPPPVYRSYAVARAWRILFGGDGQETYEARQRMLIDTNCDERQYNEAVMLSDRLVAGWRRIFGGDRVLH